MREKQNELKKYQLQLYEFRMTISEVNDFFFFYLLPIIFNLLSRCNLLLIYQISLVHFGSITLKSLPQSHSLQWDSVFGQMICFLEFSSALVIEYMLKHLAGFLILLNIFCDKLFQIYNSLSYIKLILKIEPIKLKSL